MGNKNSGGNGQTAKHGVNLTARTRGSILNALDVVDADAKAKLNKPVSQILADEFKNNPLKFMDMAAKYIVKDVNIDMVSKADADKLSDTELADIIAKRARARHEANTEILPAQADISPI